MEKTVERKVAEAKLEMSTEGFFDISVLQLRKIFELKPKKIAYMALKEEDIPSLLEAIVAIWGGRFFEEKGYKKDNKEETWHDRKPML